MLILAATPIGNVADASPRLVAALKAADVVAAEDTRRARRLASDLAIDLPGRLVSYFEGNEERRTPELVEELEAGRTVVLITDAGMPAVSDPGYRLVAAAVAAGIEVTAIPGPSAATTALALSGLPSDRFCFEGFLPRTPGKRDKALAPLAAERRTMVFFEAPHRIVATLQAMSDTFGADRPAALCRELTKTYEEVVRLPLGDLARWAETQDQGVRGEVSLVIAGAPEAGELSADDLRALVAEAVGSGMSKRDAIADVVARTGARRSAVYDAAH